MTGHVMKLAVGMFVVARRQMGRGRIVDTRVANGYRAWLVKFSNTGELLWMGTEHLTAVDS